MDLKHYLNDRKGIVDSALGGFLPEENAQPSIIHEAMRYSTLDGGKRIRPILTLAATEAAGGQIDDALPSACAIEMIHAFSLIHDDLPCMDDDDLRRGKPTNHKIYGEAIALLAGDALFALAFETICKTPPSVPPERVAKVIRLIAEASGTGGMVGGQVMDLLAEGKQADLRQVQDIHRKKTGALLLVSVLVGGHIAGASVEDLARLTIYGEQIGLAFQIVDDILDVEGEQEVIGKKTGADAEHAKATYPATVGLKESKRLATQAAQSAVEAVDSFGPYGTPLAEIAKYIVERNV